MLNMKPLRKKAKIAVAWTTLMTVVGTAILHQWQFFALGLASVVMLLLANHFDLLDPPDNRK
jgi:hypothetical protein